MPGDWEGPSPYGVDENAEQVIGLMDALGVSEAVLVGHSAGCVVAVTVADTHPERVQALVLEAPALYEARSIPGAASALLRTPQMRRIGPLLVRRIAGSGSEDFVRSAYFDEGTATPEVLAGYRLPLSARDWDRALWELVAAPRPTSAVDLLPGLDVPTLVLAGRQDTFVPYENSVRVSEAISGAKLVSFERTGHLPHEEKPERFADEVSRLLTALER
jgi:pimeloyl-ACP methyl ester carboxylesterase